MSNITKRIGALIEAARNNHAYKLERAILKFTEKLSLRMTELGMSPSGLAKKISVKPPYISKILRGTSNFTFDSLIKIASAVDCDFVFDLVPKEASQKWEIVCQNTTSVKFTAAAYGELPESRMASFANVYEEAVQIEPISMKIANARI